MKPSALIAVMTEHPLALQARNLHNLVEIGVDTNTTLASGRP